MADRRASSLLFIPSAYGLAAWSVTLVLYRLRLIDWYPSGDAVLPIFAAVLVSFTASVTAFRGAYARTLDQVGEAVASIPTLPIAARPWHIPDTALWALHLVGFAGLGLYLREILEIFDGFAGLLDTLFSASHLIRQADTELIGIYFSYFGWMAIPLTVLRWRVDGRPPRLLLAAAALQVAGNLLYIDRTRPIWIMFVSVIVIFPFVRGFALRQLALRALGVATFGIAAFYAIGFWIGKTGEGFFYYGHVGVSQELAILYYYLTSGFAYFEAILDSAPVVDYVPQRTLYPLFKVLALLGLVDDPPSQVLPFVETPFPANVGTFLEPLYSDGGMPYLWAGILAATFGVDFVALRMLRSTNPYALFFWANLCFVSFISFFVPKLASTPVWLFAFIAIATGAVRALRPRAARPAAPSLRGTG
ncbi:MAG: hypothetical protein AB7P08_11875 [Burkholderiales bacterium]